MRNASFDSMWEIVLVVSIGILILTAVGYAICKIMGLDRKAFGGFVGIIIVIILSFLLAARVLISFLQPSK
jgi:hypothetical protein